MALYLLYREIRDEFNQPRTVRFGKPLRDLDKAKAKARSIKGLILDEQNKPVGQAVDPRLPLFVGA